jgi:hypothetical protein
MFTNSIRAGTVNVRCSVYDFIAMVLRAEVAGSGQSSEGETSEQAATTGLYTPKEAEATIARLDASADGLASSARAKEVHATAAGVVVAVLVHEVADEAPAGSPEKHAGPGPTGDPGPACVRRRLTARTCR